MTEVPYDAEFLEGSWGILPYWYFALLCLHASSGGVCKMCAKILS